MMTLVKNSHRDSGSMEVNRRDRQPNPSQSAVLSMAAAVFQTATPYGSLGLNLSATNSKLRDVAVTAPQQPNLEGRDPPRFRRHHALRSGLRWDTSRVDSTLRCPC